MNFFKQTAAALVIAAVSFAGCDDAIKVTGVSLDETGLTLVEGKTATLTATIAPDDATDKAVTWKSDNPGLRHLRPKHCHRQRLDSAVAIAP